MSEYTLWLGDCLDKMSQIEDGSIDMILADLPYGTTACKWDVVIPFEPLWKHYKQVIKKNGVVVLFGNEPFSSFLRLSNLEWYKYDWVWDKVKPNGFAHAPNRPMMRHENVLIFSPASMGHKSLLGHYRMSYNPLGIKSIGKKIITPVAHGNIMGARPNQVGREYEAFTNYPHSIQVFSRDCDNLHPTQKPVALLEYLIRTYTNEGETVLDNTCGSGSTLEAAMRTGRKSIGIEKDPGYFEIASQRLARVAAELRGDLNHLPMFRQPAMV